MMSADLYICDACGWRRFELPGACAREDCGLALLILHRRESLRRRLGTAGIRHPVPASSSTTRKGTEP